MKVVTVLGTRPEIIRLSRVIEALDQHAEHILVHTGQNYDPRLNDVFFEELSLRGPDYHLGARGGFGEQVGTILSGVEQLFRDHMPDRVLILGDTTSGLAAIPAKRMGIPVFHMEAGNRCYDDRVPEEVNRRIIDHTSDYLMPYTERSRQNLLREGIPGDRIFVTGNPILEVINYYDSKIKQSRVLESLGVEPGKFFLITIHRAENVDIEARLASFVAAFNALQKKYNMPVIVSTHPRTRVRLRECGFDVSNSNVRFLDPFGFFDFISLERQAYCVLSDSGTVQEECSIFRIPSVTIRDVTERPETLECGSAILSGSEMDSIMRAVDVVTSVEGAWEPPPEYLRAGVSKTVLRLVMGYSHRTKH